MRLFSKIKNLKIEIKTIEQLLPLKAIITKY